MSNVKLITLEDYITCLRLCEVYMDFFSSLIDKIFSSKLLDKNILITLMILILVGLNLLGIDINYLSQSIYVLVTLVIINIMITITLYPITSYRLKAMNESLEQIKELSDLVEDTKEDYDFIKSRILNIDENLENITGIIKSLSEELKGLPNVKALKLILELRTRGFWNELFRECLKYTLTYQRESSDIVMDTFKNNFIELSKNYLDFIKVNIKNYNLHETITDDLNNKINNSRDIIIIELAKDKRVDEKLYIISLILKSLQDDINSAMLQYLRTVQANIL